MRRLVICSQLSALDEIIVDNGSGVTVTKMAGLERMMAI